MADVTRFLDSQTRTELASKVPRILKHPQLAGEEAPVIRSNDCSSQTVHVALPLLTSEFPYMTIHWLNDDILFDIFNWYLLDDEYLWNVRFWWSKLSHVCRRWRNLIYQSTSQLGMHIQCTNGSPILDTLDHLPPLPLFVNYGYTSVTMTEQDELGLIHALRLHDRVRHIDLDVPPPTIVHKVLCYGSFLSPYYTQIRRTASFLFPHPLTGLLYFYDLISPTRSHLAALCLVRYLSDDAI